MLDVSATAQVLAAVNQALAAHAGGAAQPVSPTTLAVVGGVIYSHVIQPHMAGMEARLKPLVGVVGPGVVAAVTAMSNGSDWRTAAGYGAVASVAAAGNHWALFSGSGLSSFLAGVANAMKMNSLK